MGRQEALTESPAWRDTRRPWCSGSLWCPLWARSYSDERQKGNERRCKNGFHLDERTMWESPLHFTALPAPKCSATRWRQSRAKSMRTVQLLCWKAFIPSTPSSYGTNLWSLSPCGVRPIRMHWGVKLAKGCCLTRKTVFWQEKADVSHSSSTWPPEVKTRVYHGSIWFCFFSYKHSKNRLYIETHSNSDLIYIEGSVLLFALLSFTSVLTDSTLLYWLYFSYTQMSWQWPRLRLRPPQWGKQDSLLYWSL